MSEIALNPGPVVHANRSVNGSYGCGILVITSALLPGAAHSLGSLGILLQFPDSMPK